MRATPGGLLDCTRFVVPRQIVDETIELLVAAGADGNEAMVVWGAVWGDHDRKLECRTMYCPEQLPVRTEDGVAVLIAGDALRELNRSLSKRGEVLAVQVHAHPDDAYHSATDDRLAVATTLGALSIVVPHFAAGGLEQWRQWATYRLGSDGWDAVSVAEVLLIQ